MRKEEVRMKTEKDLKERTKKFALRIIKLVSSLPRTREADVIGGQVLKSGTSVGANYREATRARSKAEFRSKIGIVEQEADETLYWLELLEESEIISKSLMSNLIKESDELVAIFTTIGRKSKQ
jgi:four helix bundle protein